MLKNMKRRVYPRIIFLLTYAIGRKVDVPTASSLLCVRVRVGVSVPRITYEYEGGIVRYPANNDTLITRDAHSHHVYLFRSLVCVVLAPGAQNDPHVGK